jgi:hypothetical protein
MGGGMGLALVLVLYIDRDIGKGTRDDVYSSIVGRVSLIGLLDKLLTTPSAL